MKQVFAIAGLLGLTLAAGDALAGRKLSCPVPDGIRCASTAEVYEKTANVDHLEVTKESAKAQKKAAKAAPRAPVAPVTDPSIASAVTPDRCCSPATAPIAVKGDTIAVAPPATPSAITASYAARLNQPTQGSMAANYAPMTTAREASYREPAKVMRIFFTPWEDEQGDLNMAGYVLSEVEPRKWTVGMPAPSSSDSFVLLQAPGRDAAQEANPVSGSATASDTRTEM